MSPFHAGGRANSPAGIAARQIRLEFRALRLHHADRLDDLTLWKLHRKIAAGVTNPELQEHIPGMCADALIRYPRPTWVETLVGPYPLFYENANPADIASIEEFGPGDPKGAGGQ